MVKALRSSLILILALGPTSSQAQLYQEVAASVGLQFSYWNGMTGERYFSEVIGGGVALFDYDLDGDLDVFFVQGHLLHPTKKAADAVFPPPAELGGRLFRNRLQEEGRLRFEDVTHQAKIATRLYGMGVAVGDLENDGWPDLYLTGLGPNEFWRNRGDGTFEEVIGRTGTQDERWSVPAFFFDFDGDSWLDLFVGNYVDFRIDRHQPCFSASGAEDYCGPIAYPSLPDRLFRNRGDGTFEDVSIRSKIASQANATLGAIAGDFNHDRLLDLYLTNDGEPNTLWQNRGDGTFENTAMFAGCAVNAAGLAEASMGLVAGDVDGDRDEDLFMTHLTGETNTLYVNLGDGFFEDQSGPSGLGPPSFSFTGFGARLVDLELDGDLDVVVVNGAVKMIDRLRQLRDPFPLHQTPQVFSNSGQGRFREITADLGEAFAASRVSRGLAAGDLDNDGDEDLVVVDQNAPARLWRSEARSSANFLGIELWDAQTRRVPAYSRVGVQKSDGSTLWRQTRIEGSYGSVSDPRLIFGLGKDEKVEQVRVEWWNGKVEEFGPLAINRYHRLELGRGRAQTQP